MKYGVEVSHTRHIILMTRALPESFLGMCFLVALKRAQTDEYRKEWGSGLWNVVWSSQVCTEPNQGNGMKGK